MFKKLGFETAIYPPFCTMSWNILGFFLDGVPYPYSVGFLILYIGADRGKFQWMLQLNQETLFYICWLLCLYHSDFWFEGAGWISPPRIKATFRNPALSLLLYSIIYFWKEQFSYSTTSSHFVTGSKMTEQSKTISIIGYWMDIWKSWIFLIFYTFFSENRVLDVIEIDCRGTLSKILGNWGNKIFDYGSNLMHA